MHSVLLIDEILRNIFSLCLYHDRPRHDLVSASRSCKSWKDPALDLVWDRLTSFEPLLLLLPGVLVVILALYTLRTWLYSGRTRGVSNMSVTDKNLKLIPPYPKILTTFRLSTQMLSQTLQAYIYIFPDATGFSYQSIYRTVFGPWTSTSGSKLIIPGSIPCCIIISVHLVLNFSKSGSEVLPPNA